MGGGGGGDGESRELDRTPTWAVSLVTVVIIIISIVIEKIIHKIESVFHKRKNFALVEAVEKIKAELMILGFISLLLTFGQSYIASICVPVEVANYMWPCEVHHTLGTGGSHSPSPAHEKGNSGDEGHHRRLLLNEHRMLSGDSTGAGCPAGKVSLISLHGLHQLHVFIFFLAVFHVFYGSMTMILGTLKIRGWKDWEEQSQREVAVSNDPTRFRLTHETSFVKSHTNPWMEIRLFFYLDCFFRHMLFSVQRSDYFTLRHGFVSVHLTSGTKFNFQKYIQRSLADDFKVVVGIPPFLWIITVIYQLLNLQGGLIMFWLSLMPMIMAYPTAFTWFLKLILAVGTKLQSIITQMAIEIKEKHAVIQGIPLVQVSDRHFWFGKPTLVLTLIHLALFQNSFEITHFMWIWYEFGLHSCFHKNLTLAVVRVVIGVVMQFVCSYITLPLYALVTQMGSHMKRSVFDAQTSKALMSWHHKVKHKDAGAGSEASSSGTKSLTKKMGGSGDDDDSASDIQMSEKGESANITAQVDISDGQKTIEELLTAPC